MSDQFGNHIVGFPMRRLISLLLIDVFSGDLLKNTAELVDVLLDLEPDLCVSWATEDFIQALLEATEQIG